MEKNIVQKQIEERIQEKTTKNLKLQEQGYNVYLRKTEDQIYKIENTTEYFLGQDQYLYIIYAYGNANFTTEMDVIVF